MIKPQKKRLRLINVAIGLTVAAVVVNVLALHIQQPIDERGMLFYDRWKFIVQGMTSLLPMAAVGAWALLGLGAMIRWSAGFEGY